MNEMFLGIERLRFREVMKGGFSKNGLRGMGFCFIFVSYFYIWFIEGIWVFILV